MATDIDAKDITLRYADGSLTMTRGNAKALFGEDSTVLDPRREDVDSAVKAHTRVRVIGGASTNVAAHNRNYKQWATSNANNAAAGSLIYMEWDGSEGSWAARVTGTMAALGSFLQSSSPKLVGFRTARGRKYGPFQQVITP